jgi:SPP1 family predicted phage head-tail adaptor
VDDAVLSRRAASDPGRLRVQLVLERATPTGDGAGGATLEWNAIATVAADMSPVGGEERVAGEGLADLTLQRIVIRRRADIRGGDRFRLGERLFRIRSLTDPDEDGRYLVCMCDEEGRP